MKYLLFILILIFNLISDVHLQSSSSKLTTRTTPRLTTRTTPRSTSRTTPRSTTLRPAYCYVCTMSTCPRPFPETNINVATYYSANGWCTKTSVSTDRQAMASRDIDGGYVCQYYGSGCRWTGTTYFCCCKGSYCNTARFNSNISFYLLFLSFFIILFEKKIFY